MLRIPAFQKGNAINRQFKNIVNTRVKALNSIQYKIQME